ncbi:protein OPI10 homolog [Folsomia candida]|uniref:Protein OPI10 n=1 Tax=Folsomia candida TaxID=158441 RepID=A0A226DZT2_FOLCA|nr:protein OPI10 homolog [Folsomia candida]XP_021956927.1 protein OPI10 homolog [Folsomia candida]OXA50813.1 Protein OPI10 [Folsomia candida]
MFGIIVSGRLVQTNFVQVVTDLSKFIIDIPQADSINHVVVFLTGATPFPAGMGGQIYFSWPDPQDQIVWHLLGHISNDKPSAIFKISNLKKTNDPSAQLVNSMNSMLFGQPVQSSAHNAQIGVSLEPLETIMGTTPAATTDPSVVPTFIEFTQKMLENFFNYVSSFGDTNHISMAVVQQWYQNFTRRLQADPYYWR